MPKSFSAGRGAHPDQNAHAKPHPPGGGSEISGHRWTGGLPSIVAASVASGKGKGPPFRAMRKAPGIRPGEFFLDKRGGTDNMVNLQWGEKVTLCRGK